jgi:deoxyribose-phosphate aldolase
MSTPTLATGSPRSDLSDVTHSDATLRRFLEGLPGVDQVGAETRAAGLSTRSIKTTAKAYAIDLAIRMVDLTTLEGQDTPGKVRTLCAKAVRPDPTDPTCPSTAAICVYPDMVATAKEALGDSGVHIASVATAFPSGRAALDIKLADTKDAVEAGPTRSTWSSTGAPSCPVAICRCSRRSPRCARPAPGPTGPAPISR